MIKAVVFDFDGTLTPLTLDFDLLRREVEAIARSFVPDRTVEAFRDRFILEMIDDLARHIGEETGTAFRHRALARLTDLELESARGKGLFPYVVDVLATLKGKGIKTSIITRTSAAIIREVFPGYGAFMSAIIAREHTNHFKPDPRHLCIAAEEMALPPKELLMVGDHPTDISAGRAAGALTAGVLTGRTDIQSFEAAGADFIVSDVRGIVPIIARHNNVR